MDPRKAPARGCYADWDRCSTNSGVFCGLELQPPSRVSYSHPSPATTVGSPGWESTTSKAKRSPPTPLSGSTLPPPSVRSPLPSRLLLSSYAAVVLVDGHGCDRGKLNNPPRSLRPTVKEVASAAGVSTQTVSRVINERPAISPETRKRVQDIIDRLGYQPSTLARSLIRQRSYTLGVVTAGLRFIGPSRTLNRITSAAEALSYSLLLEEQPRFDSNVVTSVFQKLLSRHVDGIIWAVPEVGDNHNWVDAFSLDQDAPIFYPAMQLCPGMNTVSVDNYAWVGWPSMELSELSNRIGVAARRNNRAPSCSSRPWSFGGTRCVEDWGRRR